MKFLANENVPFDAVSALQETGHDVIWVRVSAPGSSDEDVLSRAVAEDRVLITFDKDFGELAFRSHLSAKSGIILFRIPESSSSYIAKVIVAAINSRSDWAGHFSVVAEKIKMLMDHIKDKMDDEHRQLVETYFMKEQMIGILREGNKLRLSMQ